MGIHNISSNDNSNELRFHLVLKFYYSKEHMIYFMNKDDIPDDSVELLKEYGSEHRFFPYTIFNSVEETPINWSYLNKDKAGKIYERIELFVTLTNVTFERYSPFVLKLLNIRVGTDGTYKTNLINMIPKKKNNIPQIDWGVFLKKTSLFTLPELDDGEISVNEAESNVFCKMVVRDLSQDTKGNLRGVYTRIYTCLFFESSWSENLFKYVILSAILLSLLVFTPLLDLADLLAINLALILTEVALLFVLKHTEKFTTTEIVIVSHILSMVFITILTALNILQDTSSMLYVIITINVVTILFVIYEYIKYKKLIHKLKTTFFSNGSEIGDFTEIDKIV